jgi:hypothetical protein
MQLRFTLLRVVLMRVEEFPRGGRKNTIRDFVKAKKSECPVQNRQFSG